jgi:AcrR family transcriptional regulator
MQAMEPRTRRGRPRDPGLADRRREEILDAATILFALEGYECADLQHAADSLSIAKGTIYRYFETKEKLFLAAVDRVMKRLMSAIEAASSTIQDPLERIAVATEAYLRFFADHPEYVELLIQERAGFKDRKRPTYFEYREANRARAHELYSGLIAAGKLRALPTERLTEALGALIYGAMFTNYMVGRKIDPRRQARELLDIVFHGILTPQESQRMLGHTTLGLHGTPGEETRP